MRIPCQRCGADLPPPDPDWDDNWWQQQLWYPAWAAADQRERQEQQDRADAERRDRDQQAEAARQQAEEQRRQADEDRKLLESMPPSHAGVRPGNSRRVRAGPGSEK